MARLVTEDLAVAYTGRPASTIRWWASQGLLTRHRQPRGFGKPITLYDLDELRSKWEDEHGTVHPGAAPSPVALPAAA